MEYENYFLFVFSFRIANLEAFPWGLFFKHKLSYFWSVRSECMMMFHKTSNWIKYAFLDMSKYKSIYMKTDLRATPLIFTHPSMPYRWWITSLCSSYHQKIFCGIFLFSLQIRCCFFGIIRFSVNDLTHSALSRYHTKILSKFLSSTMVCLVI